MSGFRRKFCKVSPSPNSIFKIPLILKKINIEGIEIKLQSIDENDYVSLTDIAKSKNQTQPAQILQRWIRNNNTLQFLTTWERVHNPDFKLVEMNEFKL